MHSGLHSLIDRWEIKLRRKEAVNTGFTRSGIYQSGEVSLARYREGTTGN
jgi:hypothetical protein